MGSTLERHPFSGLIHSAGELLHQESTPRVGHTFDYIKILNQKDVFRLVCEPSGGSHAFLDGPGLGRFRGPTTDFRTFENDNFSSTSGTLRSVHEPLLSGFRLPWPPSGCLDESTPFARGFRAGRPEADHISNGPRATDLRLICGPPGETAKGGLTGG